MQPLVLTPTDFVATTNQILETSYGFFYIEGELSQLRISKQKWLYFDVKDDYSKVSFFCTVSMLPGPLEDGMLVRVGGTARLHPQFGFSVTAQTIQPVGQGSIKQAFDLLKAQLEKEGLFETERKRSLPALPRRIALVTSAESAAYADFIKIAAARWPFVTIDLYDTLVQGNDAPDSIVSALCRANSSTHLADVLVVTRGGGSSDDLAAFNDERVVRAVAGSRIPSLVAIGHEIDISLAELAADKRASTPSNAAELLLPDRLYELASVRTLRRTVAAAASGVTAAQRSLLKGQSLRLNQLTAHYINSQRRDVLAQGQLLDSYNPEQVLRRGYTIIKQGGSVITSAAKVLPKSHLEVLFHDGSVEAEVK